MSDPAPTHGKLSQGKVRAFRAVTILLGAFAGAMVLEGGLRWRQSTIRRSDALDPGLMRYDAELGWSLSPGWSGRHRHHDYAAAYSINVHGMRNDSDASGPIPGTRTTMMVGDSFTFGLGVNDDATFVHRLQAERPGGSTFMNSAVPGYSTDQESLLIEQRVAAFKPDHIFLVVYVGNDLFDNQLGFPLQVSSPKPYFVVTEGALEQRNRPVPAARKPRDAADLVTAVWGADPGQWPWRVRAEQMSELFRVISQSLLPMSDHRDEMKARFTPALRLFDLLLQRIANECARNHVRLTVVTLAGRSFVNTPTSISGQYQEVFRAHVLASAAARRLPVIDVAGLMQARYRQDKGDWFYPNDGHLNPAGHRVVAEILTREIAADRP